MFEFLKLRKRHGYQAVPNIRAARLSAPFRGFPNLDGQKCADSCKRCIEVCPVGAIDLEPLRLDLGKCTFCGECARRCSARAIEFTSSLRLGSNRREQLVITSGQTATDYEKQAITARREIKKLFGRSLRFRQVSAGGCSGCEMELNACTNVNFDMGRFGIDFVASPRHADGLVITGPVSRNMAPALLDAWRSLSQPRLVIVAGACAISGGLFAESPQIDRSGLETLPIDLLIPGCPPHPLTVINALLNFLDRK